jgi:hypothetical protein
MPLPAWRADRPAPVVLPSAPSVRSAADAAPGGSMKAALAGSRGLRLAVSGVAVLMLAADQVSKSLVVAASPGLRKLRGLPG